MAEEEDVDAEAKPKKPILKILLLVLVVLLLLGGAVGGTLFFTGFFSKKAAANAEAALEDAEAAHGGKEGGAADGGHGAAAGHGSGHGAAAPAGAASKPQRVTKKSPEFVRFVYTYKQLDKELLSNLTGTRKVMQVQLALMTSYDDRVFKNVEKHEFAIRGAVLDVMRQVTEADLVRPEFRKELAEKMREEINKVLEKYEDFGGIDAVHFTAFVVQ